MKDPSRIPPVVAQLQKVWEAQPDLALPTLLGILGNRGIGWGSTDEDLVEALNTMYTENPGEIRGVLDLQILKGKFRGVFLWRLNLRLIGLQWIRFGSVYGESPRVRTDLCNLGCGSFRRFVGVGQVSLC